MLEAGLLRMFLDSESHLCAQGQHLGTGHQCPGSLLCLEPGLHTWVCAQPWGPGGPAKGSRFSQASP